MMPRACIRAVDFSKIIAVQEAKERGSNREAYLERKLWSMKCRLDEERATRKDIERTLNKERATRKDIDRTLAVLEAEVLRLKSLASQENSRSDTNQTRKVLRALLLCFHPDKIGEGTVLSSTAVTQIITQALEENRA